MYYLAGRAKIIKQGPKRQGKALFLQVTEPSSISGITYSPPHHCQEHGARNNHMSTTGCSPNTPLFFHPPPKRREGKIMDEEHK